MGNRNSANIEEPTILEFEFKKNNVLKVIDFVDNYKAAQEYAARLNKKAVMRRGKF